MDDGAPLWPRSPASRLWLRRKLKQRSTSERVDPLDTLFPRQRQVVDSPGRFKVLLCGRRSGKTELEVRDLAHGLLHDPPGSEMLFCATTSESARRIFWRPLRRLDSELQLGLRFDESKWTVTGPAGQILSVHGTETVRDLERQRGSKFRRIRIDECGAMRPAYLKQLVQDILQPTLMDDPESTMWLSGTPGVAPAGFWWDVSGDDSKPCAWERHHWIADQNPTITDFAAFVDQILQLNGWTRDSPVFLREYLNKWASDPSRIVFRYDPARNWLPELPQLTPGDRWVYCLACDFGVMDATSTVALCWPERFGRGVYAIGSWQQSMLTTGEAAVRIHGDWTRYQPRYLVGDVGGIGKAFQLEWNRRYPGIPMLAANKQDKRAGLEFTSDAFHVANARRTDGSLLPTHEHRGLYIVGEQPELQKQVATLQWDEEREDIQEGQDDNSAVPLMYGYKQSPAFLGATELPPPPEPVAGTTWQYMPPKQHTAADDWRGPVRRRQIR